MNKKLIILVILAAAIVYCTCLQTVLEGGSFFGTEARYYLQAIVVVIPVIVILAGRLGGRPPPFALAGVLAAWSLWILVKPAIPGTNRYNQFAAEDWAAELIRADWQGPSEDATNIFSIADYHLNRRPIVASKGGRLPTILHARKNNIMSVFHELPDYVMYYTGHLDFRKHPERYEKMAEKHFGKRCYELWRLKP